MSKLEPARTYSNPTATERIRAMLDERGVEWRGGLPTETIVTDPIDVLYVQRTDGMIHVYIRSYLTPEQAIAATLGSCNRSSNCTNGEQTGTCHDEGDPSDFCCSECGVRMFTDTGDTYTMIASDGRTIIKHPNFCPNCGRRIVQ